MKVYFKPILLTGLDGGDNYSGEGQSNEGGDITPNRAAAIEPMSVFGEEITAMPEVPLMVEEFSDTPAVAPSVDSMAESFISLDEIG